MSKTVSVILCGGAGTRLWPVSRSAYPKPFIRLPDGRSLLQHAFERAAGSQIGDVLLVTNREYYFQARDEVGFPDRTSDDRRVHFLLEPEGRNTAAAIALASHWAASTLGSDAVLLVLPADHLIGDRQSFAQAARDAVSIAREGQLVTFGVVPDAPETGYGYIETGEPLHGLPGARVKRFVEKPDLARAEAFVAGGRHLWNSGMFCFRADAMLAALSRHAPELASAARSCWHASATKPASIRTGDFDYALEIDAATFALIESTSIDYAVMEKHDAVAVVRARFDWSDIGSWNALSGLTEADGHGNRVLGDAALVDVADSFIHSEHRLVAALGLSNMLIVDTPDALLVAHRDRAQEVKRIVQQLESRGHEASRHHRTVHRPWGTYTVLDEGPGFKIKRIAVKPGASLSLQMHHHRSEHWVVVSGEASVVNGDASLTVLSNESTYIPARHKHMLANHGKDPLVIIEVQTGAYLGEDDIVRFEDRYGRVPA
ncbi:MAG: mannose-1-phosphate guanylyltransferase/mannose-6-phosphate isomerase [Betaproteobacteria bacterium RIFCSPLOWO2_12_FULL_63_13]|nr:MAG: mannose-1-phosphate guanylyltransferase/mannose-6-phosphate isomerase [Betaproteobacteria bacterium RIFCSPLOWO2_02_FULL_63_19]OGA46419.1 MAG: mannose-1-phosphate guanylyltransferase/mannose-6-phosphate isomerase [Betaproteobacteria bacterium RIFCSPLOWO2_12_FULL_63_13]